MASPSDVGLEPLRLFLLYAVSILLVPLCLLVILSVLSTFLFLPLLSSALLLIQKVTTPRLPLTAPSCPLESLVCLLYRLLKSLHSSLVV